MKHKRALIPVGLLKDAEKHAYSNLHLKKTHFQKKLPVQRHNQNKREEL